MASEIKVDTISEKTSANGVTIDSVNIKDGKIATANSIDSDAYVDGSIDTAHIADDQITLAKMAAGTDGNLITYDASGNPAAVATGLDGQVLTSAGAGAPPAFEAAAAGGKIGQVVSTTLTTTTTASPNTTWTDIAGMTVAITPAATSSKVNVDFRANLTVNGANENMSIRLMRDTTAICIGTGSMGDRDAVTTAAFNDAAVTRTSHMANQTFLDSPSSTSEVVYKLQWRATSNQAVYLNRSRGDADNISNQRTASTITVMEVLA